MVAHGTVNAPVLVALPLVVLTVILPVTAPTGTVAVIFVSAFTMYVAATSPNCTDVTFLNVRPRITTLVPGGPFSGVKLVMVGATSKFVTLVPVPDGVTTRIGPVVA